MAGSIFVVALSDSHALHRDKKTRQIEQSFFLMRSTTVRKFNLETHEEFYHLLHGGRWQEVGGIRTFKEGKEGWPGKTPQTCLL